MKVMFRFVLAFFVFSVCVSCTSNYVSDDRVIAEVGVKKLFMSEAQLALPEGISVEDSLIHVDDFIRHWIKKQLLISKAELNLERETKDVAKLVDDYRSSLIIHKYQEKLIKQKLDTLVSDESINSYYDQYPANFILTSNIVKAIFIKLKRPVENISRLRYLYKSSSEDDMFKLEDYCILNATKFDSFDGKWMKTQALFSKIPQRIKNEAEFLKYNKNFEVSDSSFLYVIKITDYKFRFNAAPRSFVYNDIKQIIINKRRLQLLKDMEDSVYEEAQRKNKFKIH